MGVLDHVPSDLEGSGRHESVVVTRDATHAANLSGGVETYVPPRLLRGVVPEALLEDYRFWRDESTDADPAYERCRGYPLGADDGDDDSSSSQRRETGDSDDLLVLETCRTGTYALDATGLPGATVRVTKLSLIHI